MMALCAPLRRILTSLWTTPRNIPRCWKAAISRLSLTLTLSPVIWTPTSKMKLDELKEFAEDNGIDLTGCTTKASILQKIREYEADAAAAAAIISPEG